jgi:hypothetical protein
MISGQIQKFVTWYKKAIDKDPYYGTRYYKFMRYFLTIINIFALVEVFLGDYLEASILYLLALLPYKSFYNIWKKSCLKRTPYQKCDMS